MWKRISTETLFEHPRLKVEEDEIELPSGDRTRYLRYGYGGDGVVIVAQNDKEEILLLKEYSYVVDQTLLQLPMGKIESDESIEAAANRELQEEGGYKANTLNVMGRYYQNHRRATNQGIVVYATDLELSQLEGDKEEQGIDTTWVALNSIRSLIQCGLIVDADTLSSLAISKINI